jgi:UDP-arabinose 4-epimerase
MATVLVTGGAGYIGSFTARALQQAGHETITLDNLSTGHREQIQGESVEADVRETDRIEKLLRERDIEAVVHFAANIEARESVVDPAIFYEVNVGGLMSLLHAMREAEVGVIVFSSTCAIYGPPQYLPLDEEHPEGPVSPYGRTKLICEWMLRDYSTAYGIRHAALRYFNASGGDREGRLGEWHQPESHLIPIALEAAATGKTMNIFGIDHDTPDGTCIRDYIHVEDLAHAHVLALEHLRRGDESIQCNLGTGVGRSVREVLDAVERVVGKPVPTQVTPAQPGDPPQLVADPRRARALLGFECRWTDFDEVVSSAWAFQQGLMKKRGAP